jgi:hypothetical protein
VVGHSIRVKGNQIVTRRKHTLVLGHGRFVGQTTRGNASVTQRKHNDSTYYSHYNETHVTDKHTLVMFD